MPRIKRKASGITTDVAPAFQKLALFQHQKEVVAAYVGGIIRFFLAWHRRAGKDVFGLDFARERMLERVGNYAHFFPFHVQARRAIWKGIDARTGQRFIDRAFPREIVKKTNDNEMSIELKNGSLWQMLGSDNYDRAAVGTNYCGVLFSEWALCNPSAWDYVRPILVENKGWVAFVTTFRGRNHAWRMYQTVKELQNWFVSLRTIEQTHRNDGQPIVTAEDVQREINEGMSHTLARQEFYCDPDAATEGAIFARQHTVLMNKAPIVIEPNNRCIRIAWGMHEEGIVATAFQDHRVIAVHPFIEINLTDCVQAIARRHPNAQLIHHAVNPDTSLFSSLDGYGVVAASISSDPHMRAGNVAAMLNTIECTGTAREQLADFAMLYAPYRSNNNDDEKNEYLAYTAMAESLAVMRSAQLFSKDRPRRKLSYSSDKGVI